MYTPDVLTSAQQYSVCCICQMHYSRLPPSQRWRIVFLRTENHLSLRKISKIIKCSLDTVQRVMAKYYSTQDVSDRCRSGRPATMNADTLAALERIIVAHPSFTSAALVTALYNRVGIRISSQTIRRVRTKVLGFHSVHEHIQQSLTQRHMTARVQFAQNHINNDFHHICFSDEKMFVLKNTGNVIWIRPGDERKVREIEDVNATVMVWGCIWYSGKSTLHTTSKTINRHTYTDILANHLLPTMPTSSRFIFQHDNAKPHIAKHTQNWLQQFGVRLLPSWPARSPEFNAIEYVWSWMTSYVKTQAPTTREQLKRAIRLAWQNIPQDTVRAYIDHIPTVCREVIAANGDHI